MATEGIVTRSPTFLDRGSKRMWARWKTRESAMAEAQGNPRANGCITARHLLSVGASPTGRRELSGHASSWLGDDRSFWCVRAMRGAHSATPTNHGMEFSIVAFAKLSTSDCLPPFNPTMYWNPL